ncbi:E3 ubiquitin-protein ligase RBBP6-like [Mytilus californianus]|uniref:E3 ubiquitin-protein ligase RBBP6-like n=1 Tax=Mytilus californianus TaxID=6549 RepID=UPI0022472F49|nr:E3 ubiquitin-protein ligase RBBP6-like [Mytilus californianus]
MACIHYKFKNSLDFDSITFDGLHISVRDLKESIMHRKKLNDTDMDLLIINALNAKAYKDEDEMIPKNASVIVARIPKSDAPKSKGPKTLKAYIEDPKPQPQVKLPDPVINKENLAEIADLVTAVGSEEDKIKAMMTQSTKDFDPANYQKKLPTGTPSPSYICFKCNKPGHFIHNCPNAAANTETTGSPKTTEVNDIRMKRPTGIPHTFLTVAKKSEPGAMSLGGGRFAVPTIDQEAFKKGKKERPPFLPALPEEKREDVSVPSELTCLLCKDLLTDAVVIPCCGNSYCDECIRNHLVEDDDHKCPTCHEENVSPDKLIINKSLRVSVNNFKNETLYQKREKQKSPSPPPPPPPRITPSTSTPMTTEVTSSPLRLDTSKTIDLTADTEPETPVLDENKAIEEIGKGIAVLSGRKAVTTDKDQTSTSNRPVESKSSVSVENYVPPVQVPIPSLGAYRPSMPPASLPNTTLPPPGYRPPLLYPPSLVPPPPYGVPPGFIPPQVSKPLSEHEFYREKKRLLKNNPLDDYTRPPIEKETKIKSRSKSPKFKRSKSPRSRSRSKTPKASSRDKKSFSRSPPPKKRSYSRTPPPKKRSYTKSRSRSPYRKKKSFSRSRSRSLTPRRSRSPRPRSLTPRPRSRSWTPKKFRGRSRSYTRSRTRSRTRSPRFRRRTYSRSPPLRRRSYSRSLTPRRRSFSRSPPRRRSKSPYFRGRGRSPGYYGRDWSPPPYRNYRSPPPRGFSPQRYGPTPYGFGGRDFPARFDQRIYEEIFQDYIARYGLPPPPPPPSGQLERGMYYDSHKGVYRRGSRSRSRSPRGSKRDKPRDRKDDKYSKGRDKDKKTDKSSRTKNKKEDDKSKTKKENEKSKGRDDKPKEKVKDKEKESKSKENKSTKPAEKTEAKTEKPKEIEKKGPEKKVVKKVVKLKDGTIVKKESLALRLKTKGTVPKSPVKAAKVVTAKAVVGESDEKSTTINRSGALKTIQTTENIRNLPQKEALHSKRSNSNLIQINTQHVLPEVKSPEVKEAPDEEAKSKPINEVSKLEPMETEQSKTEKENTDLESKDSAMNGEESDQTNKTIDKKEDVPVKQVTPVKSQKKVKVVKKVKKVKKLVDIEASQSDSASDLEKVKTKKKKRVQEINENNENSEDESPAKRIKHDAEVEMEIKKNISKGEDQLMLSPPELSKWEREDYNEDKSPDLRDKLKKKTERKPLPRSIIESAEKAITQKQPKPATVASAVVPAHPQKKLSVHDRLQKSPVRQNDERHRKSPVSSDHNKKSPGRQQRRVYMDDNQKQNHKDEDDSRRVHSRENSMQITVSSDKNEKEAERIHRRVSESEKVDKRRVSESEKSDKRKVVGSEKNKVDAVEKSEKIDKQKSSRRNESPEKESRQKVSTKVKQTIVKSVKEKKKESKDIEKVKETDQVEGEKSKLEKVNGQEENTKAENEIQIKKKKYERKESVIDESAFVPDYNEHSDSDAESDGDASSMEEEKSDKEEKKQKKHKKEKKHKKNKKHKHKHKKKKHKKNKEEKETVSKVE